MLFSKCRLGFSDPWVTKHRDYQTIHTCLLQPCFSLVLVAHAAIWVQTPGPSFPPVCAMGSTAECLDFHGCFPHRQEQLISKHWSKPGQAWNVHPTLAAAYLHCGKADTCPKARLVLPPMHVEQAGYFVAEFKIPSFCHVPREIACWICSVACMASL